MQDTTYSTQDAADFEQEVSQICDLAFAHGIDSVGYVTPADDKEKYARFIAACHEGYALAQDRLFSELLRIEDALTAAKKRLKERRRDKDLSRTKLTQSHIVQLETRRHILKKIADGLAWIILHGEGWQVRRFYLGQASNYLRPTNPESVKAEVDERNKKSSRFALMTDLTSCIQVGDILEVDFGDKQTRIIEVKEGATNEQVLGALDSFAQTQCERIPYLLAKHYGQSALKQMIRVVKQEQRASEIVKILRTGEGIDPRYGKPISILDKYYTREDYFPEIADMARQCDEKGFSIKGIDGCLLLGMFRRQSTKLLRLAFAHSIYHLRHPEASCLLETAPERGSEEIDLIEAEAYPIHDLAQGLTIPIAMPIFLWPVDKQLIMDIVFRRKIVLLYLDFDNLFELASNFGIDCRWDYKQPPSTPGRQSKDFFSSLGRRPVLTKSGAPMLMGDRWLVDILFEAERPASIFPRIAESLDSPAHQAPQNQRD